MAPAAGKEAKKFPCWVDGWGMSEPDRRSVSTPRPLFRSPDEAGSDGVQRDIRQHLPEVSVSKHVDQAEAVLHEMAGSRPAGHTVAPTRETAVQLPHSVREPAVLETDEEVVVVGHQTPVEDRPVASRSHSTEERQVLRGVAL